MLIPFITINNNHILLLSFDKLQFHFVGSVYSVSELYVMPFLLMFLFIGIFALTSMLEEFGVVGAVLKLYLELFIGI